MISIDNMSDKSILEEQYKNTKNLRLRQSLHEKYSVNKIGFGRWMFEQYPFRANIKILELGSGKGDLWTSYFENDEFQSYEMDITLSDFSDGMVDYIRQSYAGKKYLLKKLIYRIYHLKMIRLTLLLLILCYIM